MTNEFIFVYGTLRKETATDMSRLLARHCEYISAGHMRGKLYEVNGYPGAVESGNGNDKICGELHKIGDSGLVLPLLDEYEECTDRYPEPHEYVRKKLTVSLPGAGSIAAWVYVFNRDVSNLLQIESGDYPVYLKESGERSVEPWATGRPGVER